MPDFWKIWLEVWYRNSIRLDILIRVF